MKCRISLLIAVALTAMGCGDDPAQSETGRIHVAVVDNSTSDPVEGVEIAITPAGVVSTTAADGVARFEIAPGDYFVDAQVCCVGPGFIQYHEPIQVVARETAEVTLSACLSCE
jgi:hypothetical protein